MSKTSTSRVSVTTDKPRRQRHRGNLNIYLDDSTRQLIDERTAGDGGKSRTIAAIVQRFTHITGHEIAGVGLSAACWRGLFKARRDLLNTETRHLAVLPALVEAALQQHDAANAKTVSCIEKASVCGRIAVLDILERLHALEPIPSDPARHLKQWGVIA